jgi:hypothetical protein
VRSDSDFEDELKRLMHEPNTPRAPNSFMTWNMNGLSRKVCDPATIRGLTDYVKRHNPDVMAFQEVQLRCNPDRGRSCAMSPKDDLELDIFCSLFTQYEFYASLATTKYAGQLLG